MTDFREHSRSVDLSEYEQLRHEINNRTQLSAGLVAIQLAALGAGLSVLKDYPDIVIALATISSFLWLLWVDHTSQIYKIAAYIDLRLAPRLREGNQELLGWERFMRMLDQGNETAAIVLFGKQSSKRLTMLQTEKIGKFISLLFGGSPPFLILGFVIVKFEELSTWWSILSLRGGILAITSIVWFYALSRYLLFVRMRRTLDQAILQVSETPAEEG